MTIKRVASLVSQIKTGLNSVSKDTAQQEVRELLGLRNNIIPLILKLALLISILFGIVHYLRGDVVLSSGCFATGIASIALMFLPKTVIGYSLAREGIILAAYFFFILLTLRSGGTSSPLMAWLMVCPVVAVIAGGRVSGMIWTGIVLIGIIGIYLMEMIGIHYQADTDHIELIYSLSGITLILFIISVMFRFENISVKLISDLKTAVGKINELAIRDELTGTYSRRELLRLLEIEVQRSQRSGAPLTLALIDVDAFKQINDTYGHGVGDLVLKDLSKVITENKRLVDYFGRYGGEEFLLLMVDADLEAGRIIAERLHQKVKDSGLTTHSIPSFTLSIGLCQLEKDMKSTELIAFADQAMYHAKATGRNKVIAVDQIAKTRLNPDNHRGHTRFEDLANQHATVLWMSNKAGSIIFANKKWTDITGQSTENALGIGWLDMVHPDDRGDLMMNFSEAIKAEQVFMAEYRIKAIIGEYRWVPLLPLPA